MKKAIIHGMLSGGIAAIAGIIYNYAFSSALWVDFSEIISPLNIVGACIFSCTIASLGYLVLGNYVKQNKDVLFNIIFLLITFASFYIPFSFTLPLSTEAPELFSGLAIPLHIFPALFWLATKPLVYKALDN